MMTFFARCIRPAPSMPPSGAFGRSSSSTGGGPTDYSDQRGHPRLRMRHAGFSIDSTARDRWLTHMRAAVDEQGLPPDHERILWQYLQGAAFAMQNVADEPPAGDVFTAHPTT